jgi:hypothetical protein
MTETCQRNRGSLAEDGRISKAIMIRDLTRVKGKTMQRAFRGICSLAAGAAFFTLWYWLLPR